MQHFITRRTSKLYASRNEVIVMRNNCSPPICFCNACSKKRSSAVGAQSFASERTGRTPSFSLVLTWVVVSQHPAEPQQLLRARYCCTSRLPSSRVNDNPFASTSKFTLASINRVSGTSSPSCRNANDSTWQLGWAQGSGKKSSSQYKPSDCLQNMSMQAGVVMRFSNSPGRKCRPL